MIKFLILNDSDHSPYLRLVGCILSRGHLLSQDLTVWRYVDYDD